jgi:tRNA threonylcarbamoyladenosine biosynthesis protein TsaB
MILALETSTPRGSIALLDGDRLLLDEVFPCDRSQGSDLYRLLERAKSLAGGFTMIAVGIGPGSYAGVRISIASALGLALSCGAELVGLASVAALETDAREYIAVGDARRETFYYSRVKDGVCTEEPQLLDASGLASRLDSAPKTPVFSAAALAGFPQVVVALPRAAILARLAGAGRGILARGDFEPLYLREPHITQPKAVS